MLHTTMSVADQTMMTWDCFNSAPYTFRLSTSPCLTISSLLMNLCLRSKQCTYTYTYTYTCTHVHMHIHMHMHIHIHIHMHIHIHRHIHMHIHMHMHIHAHTHTHAHTCTDTYTYTCTYTLREETKFTGRSIWTFNTYCKTGMAHNFHWYGLCYNVVCMWWTTLSRHNPPG